MHDLNARQLRLVQGLTLAQMAKRCAVSVSALSRMEAFGTCPLPARVAHVAAAYGCSPAQLIAALGLRAAQVNRSTRASRAPVKA